MLRLIVLFAASTCVSAGIAYATLQEKPDSFKNQMGCYLLELDIVIRPGETAPSKAVCMQYRCEEKIILHETCLVEVARAPCKSVPGPEKARFPDCCPRVEC